MASEFKDLSYDLTGRFESTLPKYCPIKKIFVAGYTGALIPLDLKITDIASVNPDNNHLVFNSLGRVIDKINLILKAQNSGGRTNEGQDSFISIRQR